MRMPAQGTSQLQGVSAMCFCVAPTKKEEMEVIHPHQLHHPCLPVWPLHCRHHNNVLIGVKSRSLMSFFRLSVGEVMPSPSW